MTGLAQVNGRNTVQWEKRFALDLDYVRNASLWMDVKIVLRPSTRCYLGVTLDAEAWMHLRILTSRGKEYGTERVPSQGE